MSARIVSTAPMGPHEPVLRRLADAGCAIDRLSVGAIDNTGACEPPPAEHPLRHHAQVIATSHDVDHSEELQTLIAEVAVRNTPAALRGELPGFFCKPAGIARWRSRLHAMPEPS